MVWFQCDVCQESIKRNKIDVHLQKCPSCWVLTCVDCNVSFEGDAYLQHTSCVTESEKYEGKFAKVKPQGTKQSNWLEKVDNILLQVQSSGKLNPKIRECLQKLSDYSNIPRKRAKFINFVKNSLKLYDQSLAEELWSIFEKANKNEEHANANTNTNTEETKVSVSSERPSQISASKKRKRESGDASNGNGTHQETGDSTEIDSQEKPCLKKFKFKKVIKLIVKESQESLSKKELIKRASNLYQEKHGKLNKAEKKLFKERAKETIQKLSIST